MLVIVADQSLKAENVVRVLSSITEQRGLSQSIMSGNGSEFISKVMKKWVYERSVKFDFSRPGKPTDNAKADSFNGQLRQEYLNENWFMSLEDAMTKISVWRTYYNESLPHSALDWATPAEFARRCKESPALTISISRKSLLLNATGLGTGSHLLESCRVKETSLMRVL